MGKRSNEVDGQWQRTASGLLVPAGTSAEPRVEKPADRRGNKASAGPTVDGATGAAWLTTVIAYLALLVAIGSAATQYLQYREQSETERRKNADHVRVWTTVDSLVIQNASPIPVAFTWLVWGQPDLSSSSHAVWMIVEQTALEPCSRWTIDKSTPAWEAAEKAGDLKGISFMQGGAIWSVDAFMGDVSVAEIPDQPVSVERLVWDEKQGRVSAAPNCFE